eukprot:COSAG01_NODE_14694_length_1421_cov_0.974281_2_plen_95_part_01
MHTGGSTADVQPCPRSQVGGAPAPPQRRVGGIDGGTQRCQQLSRLATGSLRPPLLLLQRELRGGRCCGGVSQRAVLCAARQGVGHGHGRHGQRLT